MSKIICDICGTSYPDNANACPICGYPRKDSEKAAADETAAAASVTTAAAVSASSRSKGGRFSNKNVKKRNQTETPPETRRERRRREEEPEETGSNRGLVIAVVILAIAVLLVGAYIGWRFWDGKDAYDNPSAPVIGTNPSTTEPSETTQPAETGVPCAGMTVSDTSVEFLGAGRGWKLSISTNPEDTTDELTFASSDESVVTVTADGRLTSVGPGSATITITCGAVTRECQVFCNFEEETEPSETTQPEETTEPEETTKPTENENTDGFELDRSDVTLFSAGETFTFGTTNNGTYLNPANVEWKSEDTSIATVEGGKVTAVAEGKTTIVATYNGTTQKCIIRCRFDNDETTETTEKTYTDSNWEISSTDVTLIVGETFTLKVTNGSGETADASWSSSNAGVVSISGNAITGNVAGYTEVTATVDGESFTCIVRVIESR